jgi:hypothetical protein
VIRPSTPATFPACGRKRRRPRSLNRGLLDYSSVHYFESSALLLLTVPTNLFPSTVNLTFKPQSPLPGLLIDLSTRVSPFTFPSSGYSPAQADLPLTDPDALTAFADTLSPSTLSISNERPVTTSPRWSEIVNVPEYFPSSVSCARTGQENKRAETAAITIFFIRRISPENDKAFYEAHIDCKEYKGIGSLVRPPAAVRIIAQCNNDRPMENQE